MIPCVCCDDHLADEDVLFIVGPVAEREAQLLLKAQSTQLNLLQREEEIRSKTAKEMLLLDTRDMIDDINMD